MLTGCSGINFTEWRFPYMYPVQQGNYITQQQFNALKVGMTKDQVAGVVGNPVSQFMFNAKQWQYNYQQYKNDKLVNSYVININFDKNDYDIYRRTAKRAKRLHRLRKSTKINKTKQIANFFISFFGTKRDNLTLQLQS